MRFLHESATLEELVESDDLPTQVTASSDSVRVRSVALAIVDGPDRGLSFRAPRGTIRIGTVAAADLRLRDPTVSRLHCEIRVRPDSVRIVDLGSTNGTHVDGVSVRDANLCGGATLRVGATAIRVELGDDAIEIPLSPACGFGPVVGASVEMRRLYAVLERVAPLDATVVVEGETGTGKEIVAQAIHEASGRARGPFVAVDCGAFAESLIESELFGHTRGAFSGAVAERRGLFEEANGGTLFLDEIGELPIALQSKLLRAIETRSVRPIGVNVPRPIDVRIVAATNRPLARAVNEGLFREDLYYRLAVVELHLPPLHARRDDIPLLARHFYERLTGSRDLPAAMLSALLTRSWPGNVRELRNHVERTVAISRPGADPARLAPGGGARPRAAPDVPRIDLPFKQARRAWLERFEDGYVRALLESTGGNVSHAAQAAGVSRRFLQRAMLRLGLRQASETAPEDRR
ncbi:MAG: sigma 54-interacting transcriptional regulator [Deltaproteobacteria bacterium]|nr:sigma 54-interacting transcriptional regulator [Deltaproteobacteria bacterium]